MEVIVVFEGKEITNLSKLGAEAFVKQNKGAHIKGVETVAPVVKKKETAAGDVDEPYKRERTQKEKPVAELAEPVEPIEPVEVQKKQEAVEDEIDTHYGRKRSKK